HPVAASRNRVLRLNRVTDVASFESNGRRRDTMSTTPNDRSDTPDETVALGFIAAPGLSADLTRDLVTDIEERLTERLPGTSWRSELRPDSLVTPPVDDVALVDAVRARLLEEGWDLAIFLTDLPVAVRGRP